MVTMPVHRDRADGFAMVRQCVMSYYGHNYAGIKVFPDHWVQGEGMGAAAPDWSGPKEWRVSGFQLSQLEAPYQWLPAELFRPGHVNNHRHSHPEHAAADVFVK
nr:hypothetical protein GCM10020185_35940 [Pseudomonas brassicacearum subsp. brassicacearum]